MKQYDFVRAWENDASYDIDGPIICMTRNEAFDLWMSAMEYCDPNIRPEDRKDFSTYLKEKGITI